VPLHAPLAVQLVAFVDDHVSEALPPSVILVGDTEIVTVGAGWLFPPPQAAIRLRIPLVTSRAANRGDMRSD
jgi:hypothetical protein